MTSANWMVTRNCCSGGPQCDQAQHINYMPVRVIHISGITETHAKEIATNWVAYRAEAVPDVGTCECGADISRQTDRCTNARCLACHTKYCTPGGATSPGHGRGHRNV